jgi:hypothetical protein
MTCRRDSDAAVGQPLTSLHCDLNECSVDVRTVLRDDIFPVHVFAHDEVTFR